jgi:hypothetical protein
MYKGILALALALSVTPISALAQDSNAPAPTAEQRQAMQQAHEQFDQQKMQLRQQMRYQMLNAMTPVHRRAVGTLIGELAISPNPDLPTAAKRIDSMLSYGEQQRIVAAHTNYETQSHQLHEQMHQQMQSMMPAGHPEMKHDENSRPHRQLDAGTLLLIGLSPHDMGQPWGDHSH